MMRQIGVQPHPAAVAAAIKTGNAVVMVLGHLAVDAQIALAAKFDRALAHLDADVLPAAGAQPPQFGGSERRRADRRLRGRADRK